MFTHSNRTVLVYSPSTALTLERFKRMEDDNPCKQMVDHWEPKEIIKKTSFLKAATQLATQNRFPEERKTTGPMQQENIPTSYETAKQIAQQNSQEVWYNAWTTDEKNRTLYKSQNKPNPRDAICNLDRRDQ